jgi:hypothetical protein
MEPQYWLMERRVESVFGKLGYRRKDGTSPRNTASTKSDVRQQVLQNQTMRERAQCDTDQ